ncbi:MAG TPA: patatin-like phospholipase family protein [Dongiaceae bacterium]|nr:patatin-like phospholipase family protein [Dongiaceae bacterium]
MPFNSRRKARRGALRRLAATFAVLLLTGCGALLRHPVPLEAQNDPSIPGFTDIRFFPLTDVEPMRKAIRQAFLTETPENYETLADGWRRYNYLAISGGGSDGAFGAGILNGWSAKGNRPSFKVVTGVSTGALIAPFAFLGSAYDPWIKEAYTTINAGRIYDARQLIAVLWEESVADNKPLKELVTKYITSDLLDAIAVEHAKGRRLYVASSNMDREEPVIWDMGAIASSTDPAKLELFRSVLVASASIPAIFPPTLVKVNLDGQPYDELHCDGGVFFQSFFIGAIVDLPALIREAHPDYNGRVFQDLFIIRNGSTTPARKQIPRGVRSISERAIMTLLKVSGINDLYRLFLSTEHDNVDFYFVALPADYVRSTDEEFNEAEMNRQFDLGYQLAARGVPWRRLPPGYVLKQQGTSIAAQ